MRSKTFHGQTSEGCSCVTFGSIDELVIPVSFGKIFTDKFSKSIYAAERDIVPYHSLRIPKLVVHKAASEAKRELVRNKSEMR